MQTVKKNLNSTMQTFYLLKYKLYIYYDTKIIFARFV